MPDVDGVTLLKEWSNNGQLTMPVVMPMPVLMVQGSEDCTNPRESNCDLLLPRLPRGRLEVLPGVGHLPEVEAPQVFHGLLREFLA